MELKTTILLITLLAEVALLIGLWATWKVPALQIWPPPSGKSWQFWFNWGLFPIVYLGVGLLGQLDSNGLALPSVVRLEFGLPLVILGLGISLWGVAALGIRRSTGLPGTFRVVGPYRCCRNPQYVGIIATFLGYGLWTASGMALLTGILHALWYVFAPFLEERTLLQRFGEPYRRYLETVPRFFSFRKKTFQPITLTFLFLLGGILGSSSTSLFAQEVVPRLTLGGRGLVSWNYGFLTTADGDLVRTSAFGPTDDFSDTHILLRLDKKIYGINKNQVAGTVLGFTLTDPESPAGPVYLSQAHFFWWGRSWEFLIGRTRLQNFLIEFPTLRDDDLLDYAFVRNPYISGDASEFDLYGNVVRVSFFQNKARFMETFQVASLVKAYIEQPPTPELSGVQMFSVEFAYRLPEPLRFSGLFRKIGIRMDLNPPEEQLTSWRPTLTGGLDVNLTQNPLANWRLRFQVMYTPGAQTIQPAILSQNTTEKSLSVVASLSFLKSPYQVPRLFATLTGAYRMYPDIDAWQRKIIAGLFYQIGAGIDVGVQYEAETVSESFQWVLHSWTSQAIKVLFSFEYETMFNAYFTDRETILNLEHGFAP